MKKILIISTGKYPNGNAGAVRQHAFAKLFEICGYSPFVIGLGETTDYQYKDYDGVHYTSFMAKNNCILNRILNIVLFKTRLKKFLKKSNGFSKIMVVSIPPNALFYIKRYAKKKDIQLIHDSVEWYSPEEFSLGRYSLAYMINNAYNTKWINNSFKVIAISKYLQNHYLSRKITTTRIPVIMDILNMSCTKRVNVHKLVLVYAGTIGRKDHIREVIEGLAMLENDELLKLELRILGVNLEQLKYNTGISEECMRKVSPSLKCFGRVSRQVVLNNLEEADFTVLLRTSTQRYAKAGFPTKVVESLASATPPICNLTSDLGDYITDMVNGIVVENCTSKDFSLSVKRALKLTNEEKDNMKKMSRITAEKNFDYRIYSEKINDLVKCKKSGYGNF